MSDEAAFWQQLEAWKQSPEGMGAMRAIAIHDNAALIYQQAIDAMHPVRTYITDNTRPFVGPSVWHLSTPTKQRVSRREKRRARKRVLR